MESMGVSIFFIILMTALLFGVTVYAIWDYTSRREHARRVQATWQRQGRTIHHPPVTAEYYGSEPLGSHTSARADVGALGVCDRRLLFVKRGFSSEVYIDLDTVRWVGTREISVQQGKSSVRKDFLIIHFEGGRTWQVAAFILDKKAYATLPAAIAQQTGLHEEHLGSSREDHGPSRALRMAQDVYGQWRPAHADGTPRTDSLTPAPNWLNLHGKLYLAPDRLLYNFTEAIPLAQVRRIDLYGKGGLHRLNPFGEELLRVEYVDGDEHHVAGFLVQWGGSWADALYRQAGIPVQTHEGRKKK